MSAHRRLLLAAVLAGWGATALAQQVPQAQPPAAAATAAAADAPDMAEGEVRRIDRENGRVTLRHGEIRNLDMPPMTMVFQLADPALLEQVRVGDKVRFRAVHEGGRYEVRELVRLD